MRQSDRVRRHRGGFTAMKPMIVLGGLAPFGNTTDDNRSTY